MPTATVRALVRNLVSATPQLNFTYFSLKEITNHLEWTDAKKFFPEAARGEWILTREYAEISTPQSVSGFGGIPNDVEDMLLLLRLYRPGDLSFAAVQLSMEHISGKQYPYRFISNVVSNHSTRP